jgi:hypothetical protein
MLKHEIIDYWNMEWDIVETWQKHGINIMLKHDFMLERFEISRISKMERCISKHVPYQLIWVAF